MKPATAITAAVLALLTVATCAPVPVGERPEPLPMHLRPGGEMPAAGVTDAMLTYTLTAAVPGDSLDWVRGRLVARNSSGGPIHTELAGGCMLWPRAYLEGAWSTPAWDSRRVVDACTMDAVILHLADGEASRADLWRYALRHAEILGDSLPEGEYRIGATIFPDGTGRPGHELVAERPVLLRRAGAD
jgi:hypothetical protein